MAYQTGTSTTIENLMTQLSTFLVANGWTQDFFTSGDPGRMGLSKNSIFVAFQWSETADSNSGTLAIYQNLSNDDSTSVWLSTGDSGNGSPSTIVNNFDTGRGVQDFAGPHAAYHFFEQDASPAYCHIVVEVDTNRFRHFGFGELEKVGDWVGGEYCYGHTWGQTSGSIDEPSSPSHSMLLEGAATSLSSSHHATLHARGFPEQAAGDRWMTIGVVGAFPAFGTDRAGNDRMAGVGSSRGAVIGAYMSQFRLSQLTAFKPLLPMPLFMFNNTPTPDLVRFVGTHPDIRMVNMANLDPGTTFTIAGETWFIFPWVRKQFLKNDTEESWNGGYAYRQETA